MIAQALWAGECHRMARIGTLIGGKPAVDNFGMRMS